MLNAPLVKKDIGFPNSLKYLETKYITKFAKKPTYKIIFGISKKWHFF